MIKRSVPVTLSVRCETSEYAQGVKDGIIYTLECLLHECDVIMRISPYIDRLTEEKKDDDSIQQYRVRARFTVREKSSGKSRGEWIKTNHGYYEEKMDDSFDVGRAWYPLTDEEIKAAWSQLWYDLGNGKFAASDDSSRHTTDMFARAIEAKLKEKNGYD